VLKDFFMKPPLTDHASITLSEWSGLPARLALLVSLGAVLAACVLLFLACGQSSALCASGALIAVLAALGSVEGGAPRQCVDGGGKLIY